MSGAEQKAIPARVRSAVLERDQHQCVACGSEEDLGLHHVRFRSQGGTHEAENLATLCFRCHRQLHDGFLRVKWIRGHWYCKRSVRPVTRWGS